MEVGVNATPRPLYPRERSGTHCIGGWVGPRTVLDGCGKSRPTEIRSPDSPARSESLYQLRYSGPLYTYTQYFILTGNFAYDLRTALQVHYPSVLLVIVVASNKQSLSNSVELSSIWAAVSSSSVQEFSLHLIELERSLPNSQELSSSP